MKRIIFCCAAFLMAGAANLMAQGPMKPLTRQERLEKHVYYFAADSLRGRKAGSEDARKAAAYILDQYERMGLEPYYEDWYQDFNMDGNTYRNVVAFIEGNDPKLSKELIVLGAHYDHLGVKDDGTIYNGADDNASGSAALIEVARQLSANRDRLKRSVMIVAFDGEELGLYGSNKLAKRLAAEGADVRLMMSIDMVGWLEKGKTLKIEGVATIKDGKMLVEQQAERINIPVKAKKFENSIFTATDTEGFARKGIPTLAITTGTKSPYHKPEDDANLIDYKGLDKVTEYISELSLGFASDPYVDASGELAPKHTLNKSGFTWSLGVGLGSSYIDFTKAAFTGKPCISWMAGGYARYNYKFVGARAGAFIDTKQAWFPNPANAFSDKAKYRQQTLSIPIQALLQTPSEFKVGGLWFGIGPYISRAFPSSQDTYGYHGKPLQWGVCTAWGWKMGGLIMEFQLFSQSNNLFQEDIKAHINTSMFMLGWEF